MIIKPEAEDDLAAARTWYEAQREGLGADFTLCVEEVLQRIDRTPEMYAAEYKGVRRAMPRRFPYVVYYRVEDEEVVVIGVLHSRRDPVRWQSRA